MIDVASAIKESVTCRQFADFVGLAVNRSGFAVCPFHADKDASLKIYKSNRGWCCFGCHKGGDVINLASLYYGLSFKETLQRLNDDFNLGLVNDSQSEQDKALNAVLMAKRKAERMKVERQKEEQEAEYWAAYDKWLDSDRRVRDNEPTIDGETSKDFVNALIDRELNFARLEKLEARRYDYDH